MKEVYKKVYKILDNLLLKSTQLEDPYIIKLKSTWRTKLIEEAILELREVYGEPRNKSKGSSKPRNGG